MKAILIQAQAMELKDFISETLTQMMEGVKNAQEKAKEFGAIVNPPTSSHKENTVSIGDLGEYQRIQTIEFEVALPSTSTNDTQKGISVAFAGIGAKGGKGSNEQNSIANKIRFEIPIALPYTSYDEIRKMRK